MLNNHFKLPITVPQLVDKQWRVHKVCEMMAWPLKFCISYLNTIRFLYFHFKSNEMYKSESTQ